MDALHVYLGAALCVAAVAAITDIRTGRIPNWLTFGCMGLACAVHVGRGFAATGISGALVGGSMSIAGALICAILPLAMRGLSGMGGGDVKLLGAVGALCGPVLGMQAELYSFIAAALYAPAKLAYQGKLWKTVRASGSLFARPFIRKDARRPIPEELMTTLRFAPAVLGGVLATALARWPLR